MPSFRELDLSKVKTKGLLDSKRKVSVSEFGKPPRADMSLGEFLDCLPKTLGAKDLLEVAKRLAQASREGKTIIMGMGAHPIKVGVTPFLIELMAKGVFSLIGTNGASMVHDVEIALAGKTSEDVAEGLKDGSFGFSKDTAVFINEALKEGFQKGKGAGEALGEAIWEEGLPFRELSLFGMGYRLKVPITVHMAIGTDVFHMHPSADGTVLGEMSYRDFKKFASAVATLKGGAYLNVGSAVIMPEVFLKALSLARNLGHDVTDFITVNIDLYLHYRPRENVLQRPTQTGGQKGYFLQGHHELLIPLLTAAILRELTNIKKCE